MKWTLLLFSFAFSGLLFAADPAWIHGQGHEQYQSSRYLTALGEGSTSEDARKNAFSRLAEQLKVSIASESNIVREYQSQNEKFDQSENVNIRISTSVNLDNLEGIQIVSRYHKPETNTYYAFAVLDKSKNANDLAFRIEGELAKVQASVAEAGQRLESGQAAAGITQLVSAAQSFEPLARDIELHKLFANPGANSLLRESAMEQLAALDKVLGQAFRQLGFSPLNGDRKAGSPELGLDEPFRVRLSYAGAPLRGVPIRSQSDMNGANIDVDKVTGTDGEIQIWVRSFPYTGREENRIRLKLDFNDEPFLNKSPYADLLVLLSRKSNVLVELRTSVKSTSHDYLDVVINEGLASILSEQNYNVVAGSSADYVVEVRGKVADYPGFSGMKFTRIEGVIIISSARSGRKLKTIRIKGESTKAGALSSDIAAEKSAALLSSSIRDELLETLENNLGR